MQLDRQIENGLMRDIKFNIDSLCELNRFCGSLDRSAFFRGENVQNILVHDACAII